MFDLQNFMIMNDNCKRVESHFVKHLGNKQKAGNDIPFFQFYSSHP